MGQEKINNIIKLDSKYEKSLKFLTSVRTGEISNFAKLCGSIEPTKVGYTSDNKLWICPYGGPIIIEGEKIIESLNKVKKIHYIDYNYILEF